MDWKDVVTPAEDWSQVVASPEDLKKGPSAMDVIKSATSGLVSDTARGLGYGLQTVGVDYGRRMRESADWLDKQLQEGMTPGGQRANQEQIFTGEGLSDLGVSPNWKGAAVMQAARSLPQMAMMALPGGVATKVLEKALPVAEGATGALAWLGRKAPSAIGYGGAEGIQAGLTNAAQTQSQIEAIPFDDLYAKSPEYKRLVDGGLDQESARRTVAQNAANDVAARTTLSTGGIGALTGGGALGFLDRGAGKSVVRKVLGGGATEAIQETPQSGAEQYIQQLALKQHADETANPYSQVIQQGLGGGVVGGLTGAAAGGAGAFHHPANTEASPPAPALTPHEKILDAAAKAVVAKAQTEAKLSTVAPIKETQNDQQKPNPAASEARSGKTNADAKNAQAQTLLTHDAEFEQLRRQEQRDADFRRAEIPSGQLLSVEQRDAAKQAEIDRAFSGMEDWQIEQRGRLPEQQVAAHPNESGAKTLMQIRMEEAQARRNNIPETGVIAPELGKGTENAAQIESARALDVGNAPGNGEAVGGGNAEQGQTAGTGQGGTAAGTETAQGKGSAAPEVIAPKTVAGTPVAEHTPETLQALATAPETPANTRHAAVAALAAATAPNTEAIAPEPAKPATPVQTPAQQAIEPAGVSQVQPESGTAVAPVSSHGMTYRHPNTLYVFGVDWSSSNRQEVRAEEKHGGDPLVAFQTFKKENPNVIPQVIVATDASGKPSKVISPNGQKIHDFNSPEGRYAMGDVDAFRKASQAQIEQGRETGDVEKINAAADARITELKKRIAETQSGLDRNLKEFNGDRAKQKAGVSIKTHDARFDSWKEYFVNAQRILDAQSANLADQQKELAQWEGQKVKSVQQPAPSTNPEQVPSLNKQPIPGAKPAEKQGMAVQNTVSAKHTANSGATVKESLIVAPVIKGNPNVRINGQLLAKPTGQPVGGYYALDREGNTIGQTERGIRRFKTPKEADIWARKHQPTPARTVITPSEDAVIGKNAAGEQLYERSDGSVYRMHYGRPDFGGDLAPTKPATGKVTSWAFTPETATAFANKSIPFAGRAGDRRAMEKQKANITKGLTDTGLSKGTAANIIDEAQALQARNNSGGTMMFIQAEYLRDALRARGLLAETEAKGPEQASAERAGLHIAKPEVFSKFAPWVGNRLKEAEAKGEKEILTLGTSHDYTIYGKNYRTNFNGTGDKFSAGGIKGETSGNPVEIATRHGEDNIIAMTSAAKKEIDARRSELEAKRVADDAKEKALIAEVQRTGAERNRYFEAVSAVALPKGVKKTITVKDRNGKPLQLTGTDYDGLFIHKIDNKNEPYSVADTKTGLRIVQATSLASAKDFIRGVIHANLPRADVTKLSHDELAQWSEVAKTHMSGGEAPRYFTGSNPSIPSYGKDAETRTRLVDEAAKKGIPLNERVENAIAKIDGGYKISATAEALQYGYTKNENGKIKATDAVATLQALAQSTDKRDDALARRAAEILNAMGESAQATPAKAQEPAAEKAPIAAEKAAPVVEQNAEVAPKPASEMTAADHLRAAAQKMDEAAKPAKQTAPKPLYASRPVQNASAIIAWAKSQGFESTLPAGDMHVTVAYSSKPMQGDTVPVTSNAVAVDGGKRTVEPLGDEGAVVLKFASPELQSRWKQYRDAGASWDYEGYTPHVTITYKGAGVDLSKVTPYEGPIDLGPEKQEVLNEDKATEYVEKPTAAKAKQNAAPSKQVPVETFTGLYKRGLESTPARQAQARLTREKPNLEWKVEPSGLEHPFAVNGYAKTLYSKGASTPIFYSALARGIEAVNMKAGPAASWIQRIKGMVANGVAKQAEVEATGINDWLATQTGKVTKEQVAAFMEQGGVKVTETVLGTTSKGDISPHELNAAANRASALDVTANRLWTNVENLIPPQRGVDRANLPWWGREMAGMSGPADAANAESKVKELGFTGDQIALLRKYGAAQNDATEAWKEHQDMKRRLRSSDTKFDTYQLPGGENYRELVLILPRKETVREPVKLARRREIFAEFQPRIDDAHRATDAALSSGNRAEYDRQYQLNMDLIKERNAKAAKEAGEFVTPSLEPVKFQSAHYDQPNVLAHVRFNERADTDNNRVLFIEEAQSDWAQKLRKSQAQISQEEYKKRRAAAIEVIKRNDFLGYDSWQEAMTDVGKGDISIMGIDASNEDKTILQDFNTAHTQFYEGVQSAPFVEKTDAWTALILKRMIRYASENGFDKIAWTNGAQQFERWGSQEIAWVKHGDEWQVSANEQKGGNAGGLDMEGEARARGILKERTGQTVRNKETLRAIIAHVLSRESGAEAIDKVTDRVWERMQKEDAGTSLPRKEGMEGFYDKILPSVANEVIRKIGGQKVENIDLGIRQREVPGEQERPNGRPERVTEDNKGMLTIELSDGSHWGMWSNTDHGRRIAEKRLAEMQRTYRETPVIQQGFTITPQMREQIMAGQALFSNAQSTGTTETVTPEMRDRGLALRARITEMLGDRPDLAVKTFMATPESPIGSYSRTPFQSVISMALNAADDLSIADHEGFHAAEDLILSNTERQVVAGAFNPGRPLFNRLAAAAKAYDNAHQTNISDEIKSTPAEARAYGYELWKRGDLKAEGIIGRIFDKLRQFFDRVANAARGLGFQSAEDVFKALGEGQLANREQNAEGAFAGVMASKGADQTQTPEFKRWFGDSKVVDAEGKPLVVYHGSGTNGITVFDPTKAGEVQTSDWGKGIYFTPSNGQADNYREEAAVTMDKESARLWDDYEAAAKRLGTTVMMAGIDLGRESKAYAELNEYDKRWRESRAQVRSNKELGGVYPSFLKIENPLYYRYEGITDPFLERQAKAKGHDGIIIEREDGSIDEIVAFRPEQIKSAIGNNGQFSPTNPDIRFSHAAVQGGAMEGAREVFSDMVRSDRVLNRVISKVNTPYHIAEVHPEFKPVFDEAQNYNADVSRFANEGADLAPDLLPRIESFADFKKHTPSVEDVGNTADALYAGTLWGGGSPLEGRVWSDSELKSGRAEDGDVALPANFKPMNDKQISLYRQALAGVGYSLTEHSKSLIWRLAKQKDIKLSQGMTLAQMVAHADNLASQQIDGKQFALENTEDDSEKTALQKTIDELNAFKTAIADIEAKTNGLIEHGYFPAARFGEYAVNVQTLGKDGKWTEEYFGRFETQTAANLAKRALAKEFPNSQVTSGIMNTDAYKLFQGLNLDSLELFAKHMTDETGKPVELDPLMQEYFRVATTERSTLKRQIHRKGTPGFSKDIARALAQFTVSNATATSRAYHASGMMEKVQNIKAGDLQSYATNYVRYLQDPQEEAAMLRGFLANYYILGSIAFGAVNMTQPILVTAPYLTQHTSWTNAVKELGIAAKDLMTGRKSLTADEKAAFERGVKEGIIAPQEIHQLRAEGRASMMGDSPLWNKMESMAEARGIKLPGKLLMRKAAFLWGSIYSMTEQWNRGISFLAAYRIAKANGGVNAYEFAHEAVDATQFVYGKANRPVAFRGNVGSLVGTFKTFNISYIELAKRLYTHDKKAFAVMMLTLMALAGAQGLPFAEDIGDLLDTIGQWMGYNTNTQKALRKRATEIMGKDIADVLLHGMSAIPGVPIDVAQRMGMHNLVPGSAILKTSEPDKTRDIMDMLGPAATLFRNAGTAAQGLATGQPAQLKLLAPLALQNVAKGAEIAETGQYRDMKGRKVMDADLMDAMWKTVGFQPAKVAQESRIVSQNQQDIAMVKVIESSIADKWARGIVDRDQSKVAEARAQMRQWNTDNPSSPIAISSSQIVRRVKELRLSREERFVRSATPETRRGVREDLRR